MLLLVILVFRFSTIINTLILLFYFIKLLFTDPVSAYGNFNFEMFDYFFSTLSVMTIIIGLIISEIRSRLEDPRLTEVGDDKFLNKKISFTSFAVIILLICYVFAPLAADSNPEFQKNIIVTKLLEPFSSVTEIISTPNSEKNKADQFLILKDRVIKKSFDNNILFADSIRNAGQIIYYQRGIGHVFATNADVDPLFHGDVKISSKMFILGTDEFGRDIFSRLIYGARVSLTVGLLSVLITFILGSLLGFTAGYTGGIVDSFLNRVSDMFLSFPVIFLIILILALFGNSVLSVIIVLGFSGWMSLFKIIRSEIISLKRRDYFLTAKLMGTGSLRLIIFEILPVIAAPVIVNLVFQFGNVILAESALSYLGLGTGGSIPSWGSMIEAGQGYIYRAWWMILFPGLALFLSLFITNNLGNRIKVILNPWLRK
jgi:peptide/nickel transport system permease protein